MDFPVKIISTDFQWLKWLTTKALAEKLVI